MKVDSGPEAPVAPVLLEGPLQVLRLQWLFAAVAHKFSASVCILQAWLPARVTGAGNEDAFTLHSEPRVAVVTDPRFTSFRLRSCHNPVQFKSSMTGRCWRTGAVQMVQNLRLVPPTMHPRLYLSDSDLDLLGEALYIPIYDQYRIGSGPITVLEALLPAHSQQPICSADLLSFISAGLASLKLSVSDPVTQPIRRSALCGRRARAPPDSAPDLQEINGGGAESSTHQPGEEGGAQHPREVVGVDATTAAAAGVAKTISGPEPALPHTVCTHAGATKEDMHTTACSRMVHGKAEAMVAATTSPAVNADERSIRVSSPAAPISPARNGAAGQVDQGERAEGNRHVYHQQNDDGGKMVVTVVCERAGGEEGVAAVAVEKEGDPGEEWESVPRKFRKVTGMVRTQSSFHMAGPIPATQALPNAVNPTTL